jgi:hypothetical protein
MAPRVNQATGIATATKVNLSDFFKNTRGRVDHKRDPFEFGIRSSSPSANFIYGNSHRLPNGGVMCLWGLPKSGKSLLTYDMTAQVHRDDPEAVVLKWNTEFRETFQMTPKQLVSWGIDTNRYQAFEINTPDLFDDIQREIPRLVEAGAKIGMVIIDSLSNILGMNAVNQDSVETQLRGDQAKTIQTGLSRIIALFRVYKIPLVLTAQVRAEQDPNKAKYNPYTMAGGFYLKHTAEYFIKISRDNSKEGKEDLQGNVFLSELKDTLGDAEATGHKIKLEMTGNSCGPVGRSASITVDYRRGFINQHEEVFLLGRGRGLIDWAGKTYSYKDRKWVGKATCLQALKEDPVLCKEIVDELIRQDREQDYPQLSQGKVLSDSIEEEGVTLD